MYKCTLRCGKLWAYRVTGARGGIERDTQTATSSDSVIIERALSSQFCVLPRRYDGRVLIDSNQLGRTTNGNFLDICILEWSKLFGDKRGKHRWERAVTDAADFNARLRAATNKPVRQFEDYVLAVRSYRDKFVAHLDEDVTEHIPLLNTTKGSVSCLLDYLHDVENSQDDLVGIPSNAADYARCYREARRQFRR